MLLRPVLSARHHQPWTPHPRYSRVASEMLKVCGDIRCQPRATQRFLPQDHSVSSETESTVSSAPLAQLRRKTIAPGSCLNATQCRGPGSVSKRKQRPRQSLSMDAYAPEMVGWNTSLCTNKACLSHICLFSAKHFVLESNVSRIPAN